MKQKQIDFSADGIKHVVKSQFPQYYYLRFPNGFNPNTIVAESLKKLADNIERIPADKLEEFVNKYAI